MKLKNNSFLYFLLFGSFLIGAVILSYKNSFQQVNIEQFNLKKLSSEQVVIPYIKQNHKLPNYYVNKKEARNLGWKPEKGNLCNILPGKIIGGDFFSNRQKAIPSKKGRKWFEADLNYSCGKRGADRVIFSDDGLIYVTYDHYNTFEKR